MISPPLVTDVAFCMDDQGRSVSNLIVMFLKPKNAIENDGDITVIPS